MATEKIKTNIISRTFATKKKTKRNEKCNSIIE